MRLRYRLDGTYRSLCLTCMDINPLINHLKRTGYRTVKTNYGTFAPKNFRSRERKYHGMELSLPGTFVPWNFRSRERKFQELSLLGTFAPWNFRSWERKFQELSFPGTFAPWNFRSREQNSKNFHSHAKWLSVALQSYSYTIGQNNSWVAYPWLPLWRPWMS